MSIIVVERRGDISVGDQTRQLRDWLAALEIKPLSLVASIRGGKAYYRVEFITEDEASRFRAKLNAEVITFR